MAAQFQRSHGAASLGSPATQSSFQRPPETYEPLVFGNRRKIRKEAAPIHKDLTGRRRDNQTSSPRYLGWGEATDETNQEFTIQRKCLSHIITKCVAGNPAPVDDFIIWYNEIEAPRIRHETVKATGFCNDEKLNYQLLLKHLVWLIDNWFDEKHCLNDAQEIVLENCVHDGLVDSHDHLRAIPWSHLVARVIGDELKSMPEVIHPSEQGPQRQLTPMDFTRTGFAPINTLPMQNNDIALPQSSTSMLPQFNNTIEAGFNTSLNTENTSMTGIEATSLSGTLQEFRNPTQLYNPTPNPFGGATGGSLLVEPPTPNILPQPNTSALPQSNRKDLATFNNGDPYMGADDSLDIYLNGLDTIRSNEILPASTNSAEYNGPTHNNASDRTMEDEITYAESIHDSGPYDNDIPPELFHLFLGVDN